VREVLRLYADGRGLTVVGEAADGDTAVAAAQRHRPHAIILDEEMPGRHGSDILPELRAELPEAVIVLYSSGRRAGVHATPTFFVDGERLDRPWRELPRIVRASLATP